MLGTVTQTPTPYPDNFLDTKSLGLEDTLSPSDQEILRGATELDWQMAQSFLEPRFPAAFELMKNIGVHPQSGKVKFYDPTTNHQFEDDFTNVGQHLCCVGMVGYALAEFGVECGIIKNSEIARIVEADLLHDIAKPYQVALLRAVRAGRLSHQQFLSPQIYYDRCSWHLVSKGMNPDQALALFTDFGCETGGEPEILRLFIGADENGLKLNPLGTPAQQLIHLADDFVASTKPKVGEVPKNLILTARERTLLTQGRSPDAIGWSSGLGLSPKGILPIGNINEPPPGVRPLGSLLGLMIYTSDYLISNGLVRAAGIACMPHEAAWRIKEVVTSRLQNYRDTLKD